MRRILKLHRSLEEPVTPVAHNFHIITFDTQLHSKLWLELNNRIFSTHPDQGNWAMADLENRMHEPWFDQHGFFLCIMEEKLVGFCWTKIHQEIVNKEPIGELYVIGVDPAYSGKGIGKALCTQGLIYLKNKGITQGMLYVDEDNEAGKGLYKTLGFN
ncbi:GNAT family N-acetyltransferase [Candidatus Planktophila versatilis]|uniref:GNAT family N-acetyltransferase n=1 Tax=Candidatus Planktophila versatilis TaxID=1884905 RepID=UPI000BAC6E02|nr:GNAT family N-acetyltransferase [Candidatus Planktophila versatilis]ASY25892.1 mycothiol synthase [Candidatus Planktophila versatilis]